MSDGPSPPSLAYRPDIDGLRAFAVLAVMFEHYTVPPFSGGYVGVDVFFVISGYLITSLILPQIRQGTFVFANFYERRCRRLLPALYAMLAFFGVLPLFMPTTPFPEEFYQSLGATLLFVANVYFGAHQGYFDASSAEKPLLHMWSLSVEEQFYLCFPLLVWLLHRHIRRALHPVVGMVMLGSLLAAVIGVRLDPTQAFYLLPTRAWELLMGGLLACGVMSGPRSPIFTQVEPWGSLAVAALLGGPLLIYDRATLFPGIAALAPCLGAALYIWLGARHPGAWIVRLGSLRCVTAIGLMSYALYLWHWPIWVFVQHLFLQPGSSHTGPTWLFVESGRGMLPMLARYPQLQLLAAHPALAGFALTGLFAGASYLWIERPVRQRRCLRTPARFFACMGLVTVALGGLAWWGQQPDDVARTRQGIVERIFGAPESGGNYLAGRQDRGATNARAIEPEDFAELGMPQINPASQASDPPVLVALGDSHLAMFSPLLQTFFVANGLHGQQSALIRYPLLGLPDYTSWGREAALPAYAHLETAPVEHVLLSTRWIWRQTGDAPWAVPRTTPALTFDEFRQALVTTVQTLTARNQHVWLVMPVPEMPFDAPSSLEVTVRNGGDARWVGMSYAAYLERAGRVRELFEALQTGSERVHVIDPAALLCEGGFCRTAENGRSLYADDNHLTTLGLQVIRPAFAPLFSVLKAQGLSR